jgi:prophage antirepressor-like protein
MDGFLKAVIDHCKGVTVLETPTNGGTQSIKFGREGDMYRLVLKSNALKAEEFQAWVCDEVLPPPRSVRPAPTQWQCREITRKPCVSWPIR